MLSLRRVLSLYSSALTARNAQVCEYKHTHTHVCLHACTRVRACMLACVAARMERLHLHLLHLHLLRISALHLLLLQLLRIVPTHVITVPVRACLQSAPNMADGIRSQHKRLLGTQGQTVLHLAAQKGRLQVVQELLEHRAAHDALDAQGNTPVHLAAEQVGEQGLCARVPRTGTC